MSKDKNWWKKAFEEELKDKFSLIDDTTIEYCVSILQDKDSDEEDIIASVGPMIQGIIDDEDQANTIAKNLLSKYRDDKPSKPKEVQQKKVLSAPVMLARVIKTQDEILKETLTVSMPSNVNYNTTMRQTLEGIEGIDMNLSDRELREKRGGTKQVIRRDKKGQMREKRLALEREEVLHKLENKLVKLHETATEQSRIKDIKLEEVSMSLPNLELLNEVTITFSHGHKYGLAGRNGLGKTTFLKHLAAHAFPGIPKHLQIVHIEQEVKGDDVTVIETVLKTDIERDTLLKEIVSIQRAIEKLENPNKPPSTPTPTTTPTVKSPSSENGETKDEQAFDDAEFEGLTLDELSDQLSHIYNRLNEIEADSQPARASAILAGLGFSSEDQNRPTKNFSGGWRMRVSLAQALFISPDILLLDEPTNHLDLHSVLWLEEYLSAYDKTLIIVSHDRDFLNSVTTDTVYLSNKKLVKYKGNYDAFEKQRAENYKNQQRAHDAQEKKISHMQEYIEKNKVRASTAKMAQSRMKKLAKMDVIPELLNDPTFQFSFPEADYVSGAIISIMDVSFGYNKDNLLYKDVNFNISADSRIALVGSNGAGKSTLLKLILSELEPITGIVKRNGKARIERFTQHHVDLLDLKKTPLQWFQGLYPEAKHQEIRKHLGQMGITGNLALQPIYSLSGGQKSRVAFAHITWKKPHLLLLDEPTNHLDMETVDALIRACNSWNGGLLIVSHDEHMISTVCDTIWVCSGGHVNVFNGDFEDYKTSLQKQNKTLSSLSSKKT